ncbi:hypothetical protein [Peptostreptococcus stomatis]|uniref:hypothetical protein n=1 Tax=Peptostreptococcus stomatis TaxID=341694 RepID=UPI003F9F3DB4
MENQKALTSTAMLAAIWEREKKDTLELILPFIIYSMGKVISVGNHVDITCIAKYLSKKFGFYDIPNSVLHKAFKRLSKRNFIERRNREYFLKMDLSEKCSIIDSQLHSAQEKTNYVIKELMEYLNQHKDKLFERDFNERDVEDHFVKFLETKGYFIYHKIEKLQEISSSENTIHYHIAQFIMKEYHNKTEVFSNIESIVKGLLLSRVIYGYVDVKHDEKFKDVCVYVDTTLLLCIFAFKNDEQNIAAKQLMEILSINNISVNCFKHNYDEVYKIIEAYKYNILKSSNRYGQTIEYFDKLGYSVSDVERVLSKLEEYFRDNSIEIVDTPSLSSDDSGIINENDFKSSIGEEELKEHLSKEVSYKNETAKMNDVKSVAAIQTLRRGNIFKKIEECKALFVTTNYNLVYAVRKYMDNTSGSVPLLISDLDLTSLLWLKNPKRFSGFPALKIIESARISLEPTEQIRAEFIKKIEQFKNEPTVTEERAANYRQLIYTEKEKLMELIDATPENIPNLQIQDLEDLSREHYNSQLNNENKELKERNQQIERIIRKKSDEKADRAYKITEKILKIIFRIVFIIIFIMACGALYAQWKENNYKWYLIILLSFSFLGIVDEIVPRYRYINKLISILANKSKMRVVKKEEESRQEIFKN